eukprot:scaffold26047_cov75-Skeletonema_dohrnii-CCMP3373.AAC.3
MPALSSHRGWHSMVSRCCDAAMMWPSFYSPLMGLIGVASGGKWINYGFAVAAAVPLVVRRGVYSR